MNQNNNKKASGGMGLTGVIQTVFIILKLTGNITWPWTKVLIPLWIDLAIIAIALIIAGICEIILYFKKATRKRTSTF